MGGEGVGVSFVCRPEFSPPLAALVNDVSLAVTPHYSYTTHNY
jgi:hypothetical protein